MYRQTCNFIDIAVDLRWRAKLYQMIDSDVKHDNRKNSKRTVSEPSTSANIITFILLSEVTRNDGDDIQRSASLLSVKPHVYIQYNFQRFNPFYMI